MFADHIATPFLAALLGACLGSFANVLVIRLHDASSLWGRSRCPTCRQTLRSRHLVPIFSWLALGGKCAYCRARIHSQYPLVEFVSALLVLAAAWRHDPFGPEAILFWFETFVSLGVLVMVVMDLRWKELPLELMIGLGIIGLVFQIGLVAAQHREAILSHLVGLGIAVAIPAVIFGGQWLVSRGRWVGSGDIWFGAMTALLVGSWARTVIAIYLAYLLGGAVAILLLVSGRFKRGMQIPFAPALASGLLLTLWFGEWLEHIFAYVF